MSLKHQNSFPSLFASLLFWFYLTIFLDKTSYPVGMEPAAIASLFGRNSKLAGSKHFSACRALRARRETFALIHAHAMFRSHKSTLVQTLMLTHLGLNAEICAINYCQKRDYIPVPQIKQSSHNITVCCTPCMPWNICFDPCSCQITLSQHFNLYTSIWCCVISDLIP